MQTLIYGLEAWGKIGKNEGNEIEKVQGKAWERIFNLLISCSYIDVIMETGTWIPNQRIQYSTMMLHHKIMYSDHKWVAKKEIGRIDKDSDIKKDLIKIRLQMWQRNTNYKRNNAEAICPFCKKSENSTEHLLESEKAIKSSLSKETSNGNGSIHHVYWKWLIYIETSCCDIWTVCSISKMPPKVSVIIVCTPLSAGGGGGVERPTKFSKRGGGLDRSSVFRGRLLGKRGWLFSGGLLQFFIKK